MLREYNLHYKYLLWNPFFRVSVLTDMNQMSLKNRTGFAELCESKLILTCHYLWLDCVAVTVSYSVQLCNLPQVIFFRLKISKFFVPELQ